MSMNQPNLFSSLFRWAHRQDENFVTEGLVYLVNRLLAHEPQHGRALVRWLCFKSDEESKDIGRNLEVTTQVTTKEGRPDVGIESDTLLAFLEFKKGSGLGPDQLTRYRRVLDQEADAKTKRLVLLTVFPIAYAEDEEQPDLHLRWYEVADWLRDRAGLSEISRFIIDEFITFLGEQIMTVEHVGWQYLKGVESLFRLTEMLGKALENAQVPILQGRAAWDYRGYWLDGKKFRVGVYMARPEIIQFEFGDVKPDVQRFTEQGQGEFADGKYAYRQDLASEAVHFFARTKESQLDYLTRFVRNSYQQGTDCLAVPSND